MAVAADHGHRAFGCLVCSPQCSQRGLGPIQALVYGVQMDNWHILALMEGASKSSRGGVGDKRAKPGVTEDSQGDCTGAILGVKGA